MSKKSSLPFFHFGSNAFAPRKCESIAGKLSTFIKSEEVQAKAPNVELN